MLDNDLIRLFRGIILARAPAHGLAGVQVKQAYQPTQQGAESGPSAYFFKISDSRYGHPGSSREWDEEESKLTTKQTQLYETTFQVTALVPQSPASPSLTASDVLNAIAMILSSEAGLEAMRDAGVGLLRITDVRNPYFHNDQGHYEASPSFDFTITYRREIVDETPVVQTTEFIVERI